MNTTYIKYSDELKALLLQDDIKQLYVYGDDGSCVEYIRSDAKSQPTARMIGRWKKKSGGWWPGGSPIYTCGACGGSEHLHGSEYPKRMVVVLRRQQKQDHVLDAVCVTYPAEAVQRRMI